MNYYPRHIGDYLKDTAHLSLLEHGIYSRLLDVYYSTEAPLQSAQVFRLIGARSREERAATQAVLNEFFKADGDAYRHSRCDRELLAMQDKQSKARASAAKRWDKNASNANASPKAMRTHTEGNAPNTNTNTNSVAKATGAGAPPDPADVIFGLGIPLLTAANVADKNARSMLGLMRKTNGDEAVIDALTRCASEKPLQPVAWLQAALKSSVPTKRKSDALMAGNIAAAQRFLGAEP